MGEGRKRGRWGREEKGEGGEEERGRKRGGEKERGGEEKKRGGGGGERKREERKRGRRGREERKRGGEEEGRKQRGRRGSGRRGKASKIIRSKTKHTYLIEYLHIQAVHSSRDITTIQRKTCLERSYVPRKPLQWWVERERKTSSAYQGAYLPAEDLVPARVLGSIHIRGGLVDRVSDTNTAVRVHTSEPIVLIQFSLER
jgi:hypothetical protein